MCGRERETEGERERLRERATNVSSGHSRHLAGSSYATAAAVMMRADVFSVVCGQNKVGNTHIVVAALTGADGWDDADGCDWSEQPR